MNAVSAAQLVRKKGATHVIVIATHGLLSGEAPEELQACEDIDRVVVTNTVPQEDHQRRCSKLHVMDASYVLAEALRRVHNGEPLFGLYTGQVKDQTKWRDPSEAVARSRSSTMRSSWAALNSAAKQGLGIFPSATSTDLS